VPNRIHHPAHHIARSIVRTACAIVLASLALSPHRLSAQMHEQKLRTISGTVSSPDHEPLRGAVVELQEVADGEVESYITAEDGRYHFKRLNSEADYKVWVLFRNRHSRSRDISKFDDHLDKVINFTIETF
jgi:hypothetical protein